MVPRNRVFAFERKPLQNQQLLISDDIEIEPTDNLEGRELKFDSSPADIIVTEKSI